MHVSDWNEFAAVFLLCFPFVIWVFESQTKDWISQRFLCGVLYLPCGRAMRTDNVFCSAVVTHPSVLCGQSETVLADFKHFYLISFLFYFSDWRSKEKKKKGRGERVLEKQANGGSVCCLHVLRSPIEGQLQLLVRGESSVLNCRRPVIWNKEVLSWVLEGESLQYGVDVTEEL